MRRFTKDIVGGPCWPPAGFCPAFTLPRTLSVIIALALSAGLTWAQTAAEKPSVDTRRVGARLGCQCGCKDSVATCSMLECSFSKPAKEKIAKMQALGMSDRQIIDSFVREYGAGIYLAPPNLVRHVDSLSGGRGWACGHLVVHPPLPQTGATGRDRAHGTGRPGARKIQRPD